MFFSRPANSIQLNLTGGFNEKEETAVFECELDKRESEEKSQMEREEFVKREAENSMKGKKQFDVFIRLRPKKVEQSPIVKKRISSPVCMRQIGSSASKIKSKRVKMSLIDSSTIRIENKDTGHSTTYNYSEIFDGECNNKKIFERTCKPFMPNVLNYSMTWLAYGITGSGKTHTIFGSGNEKGLYYFFLKGLKAFLAKEAEEKANEEILEGEAMGMWKSLGISASFIEIYNENLKDLFSSSSPSALNHGSGSKLLIIEDPNDGVWVKNANYIEVKDPNELAEHVNEGLKQRATGIIGNHSYSSRSHAILSLNFTRKTQSGSTTSTMQFVDLAGSEKLELGNPKAGKPKTLFCLIWRFRLFTLSDLSHC